MAIAYISSVQTAADPTSATSVVGPALAVSSGNLLVAFIAWGDTGPITCTVTDSAGNTWTPGTKRSGGSTSSQFFYAANTTAGASTVVTATFSATTDYRSLIVSQYSGVATASPVDVEAVPLTGTGLSVTTNSFSTTAASTLVIAAYAGDFATAGAAGYTLRKTANYASLQDRTFSSPQTGITATFTNNSATGWNAHAIAFKEATSGVIIPRTDAAIYKSPYVWNDDGTSANANTTNAYMKFSFSGTSLQMNVVALAGGQTGYPVIRTFIDNRLHTDVQMTAGQTAVTLATGLPAGTHTARVVVLSIVQAGTWNLSSAVKVTGFTIDAAASVTAPTLRSKRAIVFGDSITAGYLVMPDGTMDGTKTAAALIAEVLDAEHGQISFGGQGFTVAPGDGIPALNTSYALYSSGVSRLTGGLFSPAPDYLLCLMGTNPSGGTSQASIASQIASFRAAAPTAWIFMCVPMGQFSQSTIAAAVAAAITGGDSKVALIDAGVAYSAGLTGVGASEQSSDGIHPYDRTNARWASKATALIQHVIEPRRFTFVPS